MLRLCLQICIAPDYVLCSAEMQPKLIASFKSALLEFNPPVKGTNTSIALPVNDDFSKIVSEGHFKRLNKLIEGTKGTIVIGGEKSVANNKIEITVVADVKLDDVLMQGE